MEDIGLKCYKCEKYSQFLAELNAEEWKMPDSEEVQ